jgi:saccharopine dehydrogenase-like NADP-dependent oxidoreductase
MKQILLFGAGKSATVLIDYLLSHAKDESWEVIVADANLQLALDKINNSPFGTAISFDITDDDKRGECIRNTDIVISMLPPFLHSKVAKDCVQFSKHLLTASYVDDDMRSMKAEIENKKLLFLCEMGLDPGIDHMSAMKLIDHIHAKGGTITSFKSHCGGLVAPESDDNPWHYKISWNPRNIVMAGKAGAIFKKGGKAFTIPYESLFDHNETIRVPGLEDYAWYPNRDSLSYMPVYGLEKTSTFIRTTLRHPSFCRAWNYVVKMGLTNEEKPVFLVTGSNISFREWLDKNIAAHTKDNNFDEFLEHHVEAGDNSLVTELFGWLGLLSEDAIPSTATCSADVLQFTLENRLSLLPGDKDMIVMLHEFEYAIGDQISTINSSLVVKGENSLRTAMAKTVGLPLGIAAKLILNGTITTTGLRIPIVKEIYEPVLKELEQYDINFNEQGI